MAGIIHTGNDDDNVLPQCLHMQMDRAAHHFHHTSYRRDTLVFKCDMFGAHAEHHGLRLNIAGKQPFLFFLGDLHRIFSQHHEKPAVFLAELALEKVHLRCADKAADKLIGRMCEDLLRCAYLLDKAVFHDNDPVAQRHGLGLIVGHVNKRSVQFTAQRQDLGAHLVSQLCVQIGQRFVHQKNLRLAHDGTADGHALPLTAGERLRLTLQEFSDGKALGRFFDLLVDDGFRIFPQSETVSDVFIHRHMGIQSVILKNHGDIPVFWRDIVHQAVANIDIPGCGRFKARDHAERGGFSAAGRADKDDKLLVADLKIERIDRNHAFIKYFADVFKPYSGHAQSFFPAVRCHFFSRFASIRFSTAVFVLIRAV